MTKWNQIPTEEVVNKTAAALEANGMKTIIAENAEEAKKKALELIPTGAEVMTMQSASLKGIGLDKEIDQSENYNSVRNKLADMDRATQGVEMQKLGAAPEWLVGSVQAVTVDGTVVFVSNTGSQLGAYVYGSAHVIWVVGIQKIVKDTNEALERVNDYVLSLESERLSQAMGKPYTSSVNKILIIKKEVKPDRITLIFVKEEIGF